MSLEIKVKLDEHSKMPTKAHKSDAGFDLYCKESINIPAHGFQIVDTGVHMEIPEGYVGFIKSKSGLNVKHNLVSEGVIDSGYTGSIVVKIYNHGDTDYIMDAGNKITQIVILPIPDINLVITNDFIQTERGNNGFGSTGK